MKHYITAWYNLQTISKIVTQSLGVAQEFDIISWHPNDPINQDINRNVILQRK